MRVILTHARPLTRVVTAQPGKLEVLYLEPVRSEPSERRLDSPILKGFRQRGDTRLVLEVGPAYEHYESFELRNPDRLIVDLHGDGARAPADLPSRRPAGKRSDRVIVIDPGHGGSELGAVGLTGLQEKEVTLDLARRLRRRLGRGSAVSVVLTRDEDRHLDFDVRTAIANHNHADLFLSIHLNSSPRKSAYGAETYYLATEATDDEARTLAAMENGDFAPEDPAGATGDPEDPLNLVLWDLAQNRYQSQSAALAESVQRRLNRLTGTRDRGVRQAPFRVLMGATMPAVLVEVGFISNPEEEERLRTASYREQVVEALVGAVEEFLGAAARLSTPEAPGGAGPAR